MEDVKASLVACVMSCKGGVPLARLNEEYECLTGSRLPVEQTGHSNLAGFLKSIQGISVVSGVVHATSRNASNIKELINRQKVNKGKTFKKYKNQVAFKPQHKRHFQNKHNNYNKQPTNIQNNWQQNQYQPNPPYWSHPTNQFWQNNQYNQHPNYLPEHDDRDRRSYSSLSSYAPHCLYNEPNHLYLWDHQVIGDEYMLSVHNNSSDLRYTLDYGTCAYGMTLRNAYLAITNTGCTPHVIILCGSWDALKGRSFYEMKADMEHLLQRMLQGSRVPIICTLPPSPNPRINNTINQFNKWLLTIKYFPILDINSWLTGHQNMLLQKYFKSIGNPTTIKLLPLSMAGISMLQAKLEQYLFKRMNVISQEFWYDEYF